VKEWRWWMMNEWTVSEERVMVGEGEVLVRDNGEVRRRLHGCDGGRTSGAVLHWCVHYRLFEGTMKTALARCFLLLVCGSIAEAQRRDIGNGGRGGTLVDHSEIQRPSRSEQDNPTPPPPPPPPSLYDRPIIVPIGIGMCGGVQTTVVIEEPVRLYEPAIEEKEIEQALMWDCRRVPDKAGFDFSVGEVVPCDDQAADVLFEVGAEGPEFVVGADTDIRVDDLGSDSGEYHWATDRRVPIKSDRCYVVWTWDNQYYKICVTDLSEHRVAFEWRRIGGERIAANIELRNGSRHREKGPQFSR